jgi:hypothetical protein
MSDVSLNFRQNAYYSEEQGGIPICLITIEHEDLIEPIRISTDPTERLEEIESDIVYGTTSNSVEYYFFPCKLKLPDDKAGSLGTPSISFDNVNRDYVAAIRALSSAPTVSVAMIMSNALDDVEMTWPQFNMRRIHYDASTITAEMDFDTLRNEVFPNGSFVPSTAPNLF